jgi:hypothetical protein
VTNDINTLMDRYTAAMTKPATECTDQDIALIVEYHRKQRQGGKAEAAKAARKAAGANLDISAMMQSLGPATPAKPTQTIKRII